VGEELGGASGAAVSERVRETRERERVSQRVVKCAGVRRVSDLGHTANIFSFFCFHIHICRVPQFLAHGKHVNFAVCPNLATRQRLHPDACFGVTKLPRWLTRDAADDVARQSRATFYGAT